MSEKVDVMSYESAAKEVESMTNEQMDNFFNEAKQAESNYQPEKEAHHEETNEQETKQYSGTDESTMGDERQRHAERSGSEDGREEYSDQQVQESESDTDGQRNEGQKLLSEQEERSYKAALKEERELRKQIQQELAEQREAAKKMSEAVEKLVLGKPQSDEVQIPSYDEDPLGHLNAKLEMANKRIEQLSNFEKQSTENATQSARQQRLMADYQSNAMAFAKDNPDFGQAYQYLVTEMHKDFMAQGYSDQEARDAVVRNEMQLAESQMSRRENPAKVIYELAKRRGYQQQPQKAPQNNLQENKEKVDRVERGIKASRSLNGKGESPRNHVPTLEELNEMSDKEFDQFDWRDYMSKHA